MSDTDRSPNSLQLHLFGGFDLRSGSGRAVELAGRKVRALVACLALASGNAWPREKLTALLWSDRSDEQARASLRQALAEMRRALGEPSPVRAEHDAVSLDPALIAVDALQFERLAKASKLDEAAGLYRGPLLDGHGVHDPAFEDWILVERTRLHNLAVDVLDRIAASQSGEAAIAAAQRLLQLDPAREETHRLLMRLYAVAGQRAQALRQYEHCRDILKRDLQVKPDAETERLHSQIQSETMPALARSTNASAPRPTSAPDSKPSIAVLPFTNMSGDPEQDYFSDGITEDIITELSRFRNLVVIARNSSFAFKGQVVEVSEVGRQLGVRYVVEGSVRKVGNRVRVTVQLVETATRNHVWAERYDINLQDLFGLQDEVVRNIVTTLPAQLDVEATDLARRKRTEDMTAYDYCLRGEWHFLRGDYTDAMALFSKTVAIDPEYARALARLGWLHAYSIFFAGAPPDESIRMARSFSERALAADNADARVEAISASACLMCGDFVLAERHAKRAMALNPNDAATIRDCGFVEIYGGRFEAGIAAIHRGTELDPRNIQSWHEALFDAHYMMRDYHEAIALFRGWREAPPHMYGELAAAYAQLGQMGEAREAVEACRRRLIGGASMAEVVRHHLRICKRPEDAQHWLEGYRKAGLDV